MGSVFTLNDRVEVRMQSGERIERQLERLVISIMSPCLTQFAWVELHKQFWNNNAIPVHTLWLNLKMHEMKPTVQKWRLCRLDFKVSPGQSISSLLKLQTNLSSGHLTSPMFLLFGSSFHISVFLVNCLCVENSVSTPFNCFKDVTVAPLVRYNTHTCT